MSKLWPVFIALLLAACAAQEETESGLEQAVQDYIEVHELAELDVLRSTSHDRWVELSQKYIIYASRHDAYLIEFARNCYELNEYPVVADVRREANRIRARFDTLRGCPIARIFAINENDVAELSAMGESMNSGN